MRKKNTFLPFFLSAIIVSSFSIPVRADYGIPPDVPERAEERVEAFMDQVSAEVSEWTSGEIQGYYIDLEDVYDYYETKGVGEQLVSKVQHTLTSLAELGVVVDQESLETISEGWDAASEIKDIDLTLNEFNEYLSDVIYNYPTNELMYPSVIPQILRSVFEDDYFVELDDFIVVVEDLRSDIENGVPVGEEVFDATIELLDRYTLGKYDPENGILEIDLTDYHLGRAAFFWENYALTIDVSDIPLLPLDLKVTVGKDVRGGCFKMDIDHFMLDIATLPILSGIIDIEIRAGFSGEVRVKPETGIDQQIQISFKSGSLEAGVTLFDIDIGKADLAYHFDDDAISSYGELGGEPVWAHYDTRRKTWRTLRSYYDEKQSFFGTQVDHLSIFTIVSTTDPALKPGTAWSLWILVALAGIAGAMVIIVVILAKREEKDQSYDVPGLNQ